MTNTRYESPRVTGRTGHFHPDNSGGCCRVCCGGTFDNTYRCEECTPGGDPKYDADRVKVVKRKPSPQEKTRLGFAEEVYEGGDLGEECAYAVRRADGVGRVACYHCMVRGGDPKEYTVCAGCQYFIARANLRGKKCEWCAAEGEQASRIKALFPPGWKCDPRTLKVVERLVKEYGAKEAKFYSDAEMLALFDGDSGLMQTELAKLEPIKLVSGASGTSGHSWYFRPPAHELATKGGRSKVQVEDHYAALVKVLETPKAAKLLAKNADALGSEEQEEEDEFAERLGSLFVKADIHFYDSWRYPTAVRFVLQKERARLSEHKELKAVYKALDEGGGGDAAGDEDDDEEE